MRNDLTPFARQSRNFCLVALMAISVGARVAAAQDRAAWMKDARWGVMTHFLADWRARVDGEPASVEHWNDLIDHFDVDGLAEQLHSVGAGYYLITIGQNSGYYLAPNATYDKLVGITPSKCSRRDLIGDLYEPLHRRGIRLMVYLPAGAPGSDRRAAQCSIIIAALIRIVSFKSNGNKSSAIGRGAGAIKCPAGGSMAATGPMPCTAMPRRQTSPALPRRRERGIRPSRWRLIPELSTGYYRLRRKKITRRGKSTSPIRC